MPIKEVQSTGVSGFFDEETRDLVLYREFQHHYLIYTPQKSPTGPYGYAENIFGFWNLHNILEGNTSIEDVRSI